MIIHATLSSVISEIVLRIKEKCGILCTLGSAYKKHQFVKKMVK